MNLPSKVVLASSSLYFADKTFDAVRDHLLAELLGMEQWIAWGAVAGLAALMTGCGYVVVHWCIRIFGRPRHCQTSTTDGGR